MHGLMPQKSDALVFGRPIGARPEALRGILRRLKRHWWASTLFVRFSVITLLVLFPATIWLGNWVNHRIAAGVLRGAAGPTALYLRHLIEPRVQSFAEPSARFLSREDEASLKALLVDRAFRQQVVSMKVWAPDGTVIFSSDPSLVGHSYRPAPLEGALAGNITIAMSSLDEDDGEYERAIGQSLFEIFVPLYRTSGEDIIAAAEFYVSGQRLVEETAQAACHAWMVVVAIMIALGVVLLAIVSQESRIVIKQRSALKHRAYQRQRLLRRNQGLLERINHAQRQISRIDDRARQRLGADLHDGPIQLISYATMRLGDVRESVPPAERSTVDEICKVASAAAADLRMISGELILPYGAGRDIGSVLRSVITRHEARTRSTVAFTLTGRLVPLPDEVIRYAARIVQEALTNAVKHAGGRGQAVDANLTNRELVLVISDEGPGITASEPLGPADRLQEPCKVEGLGLAGIQARAEALGGVLVVTNRETGGARLTCTLSLRASPEVL